MRVHGGCLCGAVAYEAVINPDRVAICHCADCQINSGGAYGIVAHIEKAQFVLLSGQLRAYVKTAESGRIRHLSFCPECGTRIHAQTRTDPEAFFGLRVGTIAQRHQLTPRIQVWCDAALPWAGDLSQIPARNGQ